MEIKGNQWLILVNSPLKKGWLFLGGIGIGGVPLDSDDCSWV